MGDKSEKADEKRWFALGHVASRAPVCAARPRERLGTLRKAGRRVDGELLFHGEDGVEVQFSCDGVIALGQRYVLRAQAVEEAEFQLSRLMCEG